MNIFHLFLKASFQVQVIILILVCFSIVSWGIIIQRICILTSSVREMKKFEEKIWSGIELSRLYQESTIHRERLSGSEKIFYVGFKEFTRLHHDSYSPETVIKGVSRTMRIMMNRELEKLETYVPFLGTVGSVSPYIGLFGTVWGIMRAFIGLGTLKQTTLQAVAPGIAEALIVTSIGLFAAIPAIVAFNYLNLQINKLEQKYSNFIEEFISILHRQIFANNNTKQ